MPHFTQFHSVIKTCIANHLAKRQTHFNNHTDWRDWRLCFEGGRAFRDHFLEPFIGRETTGDNGRNTPEFIRRRKLSPIPTYAKREINAVKNAIAQRLPDIIRRGGSDAWQDAIKGDGRGVDLRGSAMNAYITKSILPELLVMGQVGILVDAPRIHQQRETLSRADVPDTFQPWLNRFTVEETPLLVEARSESSSDWSSVLLESQHSKFNLLTGENDCEHVFRYYWLDEFRDNRVNIVFMDKNGAVVGDIIETQLTEIPFVWIDIGTSLMADVCSYQITLLNMLSADSNYAIDANYSVLTRQRGSDNVGIHLRGGSGDEVARTGAAKGLFYNRNEDRPQYIAPPTGPMAASLNLRREMKDEIHELVTGAITDLGGDGSIEAGLSFIGTCLEIGEERLWDFWTAFEESREEDRQIPTIGYPDSWSLKTDKERVEEANELLDLSSKIVGRLGKKEAAKMAVDRLYRGKVENSVIERMKQEIDSAPYSTSDPKIILPAKKEGVVSNETSALALGFDDDEGERAKADAAERAAQVVAAQADAQNGAARGNPDGSVDPNANRLAREGETEGAGNLRETDDPGRPSEE